MQVKAQSFVMLVQAGIHPLIALKTVGLWNDPEKVFLMSKPYLDNIYKTIDDAQEQEERAQALLAEQQDNGITETGRTEPHSDTV